MDDETPKDSARSPVEQFARFLMVSAKEDPSLLRRTPASPVPIPFLDRVRDLPAMLYPQPEPDGKSKTDPYLEELVALAIASAREAEDASREAHAAIARARRGTLALASVAALGILVGIAGVSGYRPGIGVAGIPGTGADDISVANTGPAAPAGLNDPGQSTASRFAALRATPDDAGNSPASVAPTPAPTPETSGLGGAPADARAEVTQVANAKDEASDVSTPSRQQANAVYSPLRVSMEVPSGASRLADDHPVSVNTDRPGPRAEYAEQTPVSRRAHRHVRYARYAYAPRPFDQFSRFLTVIHWRINSALR
jgi:hypothetical protein